MTNATESNGLVSVTCSADTANTMSAVEAALAKNDAINVVGVLDHQANAKNAELELSANQIIFFGNAALGTPLMQQNQQLGIELPQKIHIHESGGSTTLSYNSTSYLQSRYGIDKDTPQLDTMGKALAGLAQNTSGSNIDEISILSPLTEFGQGLITITSNKSVNDTYDALVHAIQETGTLAIFREIDHGAAAAKAGLELRATKLVIFGNAGVGTPLMMSQASAGIDLPLKTLVYEDAEGNVKITHNDPTYLAARHGITDQNERLVKITGALAGLATKAAG